MDVLPIPERRPAEERAAELIRTGNLYLDQFGPASGDARWVTDLAPRLASIIAAVDDLILVDDRLAAGLALIAARYHRVRHTAGLVTDQLAGWAEQLPISQEARAFVGELTMQFLVTGRLDDGRRWCDRHQEMTVELGYPCPVHPTDLLRSASALAGGDPDRSERLAHQVLASSPNRRTQMLAWWDIGLANMLIGRLDEALAATMEGLAAAADIGDAHATAELGCNLTYLACLREGRLVQARNILRWMDRPWWDSMQPSAPRLADLAGWVAADIGRHVDAARLARLLEAAPPLAVVFSEGERPTDLLARVGREAPAALRLAESMPLLASVEALAIAKDVLTDPALPPQAPPIDEFLTGDTVAGATLPDGALTGPLAVLPGVDRRRVATAGTHLRWKPGTILTSDTTAVHVVLRGWVGHQTVTTGGETATLDVVGRGEIIGNLPGSPPAGTGVALGPVETFTVPASLVASLVTQHPAFSEALHARLAARFARLETALTDAMFLPVDRRVLRRLVDLCDRLPPAGTIEIALSQDEIASMTGSTRPTVSRVLRRAEADGILTVGRRSIVVTDPDLLRSHAG